MLLRFLRQKVVQRIGRREHPVLFWAITVFWLVLAALTISVDMTDRWFPEIAISGA